MTTVVQFENVGLRYGTGAEVLRDVSLRLDAGSLHFLTGPSGAGKTSLLKLLYLSQQPSRGLISIFGHDVVTMKREMRPELRQRIGVVFQDFRLLNHLSAFDNVAVPLRVRGVEESAVRQHVSELLDWVGLTDRAQARPPTLSGGEQQRVAIARAVIGQPELLVADEPTGNVDPDMAGRLLRLFMELNRLGTTLVIATHDMQMIGRVAGANIINLDRGALTPSGWTPPVMQDRPLPRSLR